MMEILCVLIVVTVTWLQVSVKITNCILGSKTTEVLMTEIILDLSKQDYLLMPKYHVLFCFRVFDKAVPSARNAQCLSLLEEVLSTLHCILSMMPICLIRWSQTVLPLNLIIIFFSLFQAFFLFCLVLYLIGPLLVLFSNDLKSYLRAGAVYLKEHIAQQCMWEWVFVTDLLIQINCDEFIDLVCQWCEITCFHVEIHLKETRYFSLLFIPGVHNGIRGICPWIRF